MKKTKKKHHSLPLPYTHTQIDKQTFVGSRVKNGLIFFALERERGEKERDREGAKAFFFHDLLRTFRHLPEKKMDDGKNI